MSRKVRGSFILPFFLLHAALSSASFSLFTHRRWQELTWCYSLSFYLTQTSCSTFAFTRRGRSLYPKTMVQVYADEKTYFSLWKSISLSLRLSRSLCFVQSMQCHQVNLFISSTVDLTLLFSRQLLLSMRSPWRWLSWHLYICGNLILQLLSLSFSSCVLSLSTCFLGVFAKRKPSIVRVYTTVSSHECSFQLFCYKVVHFLSASATGHLHPSRADNFLPSTFNSAISSRSVNFTFTRRMIRWRLYFAILSHAISPADLVFLAGQATSSISDSHQLSISLHWSLVHFVRSILLWTGSPNISQQRGYWKCGSVHWRHVSWNLKSARLTIIGKNQVEKQNSRRSTSQMLISGKHPRMVRLLSCYRGTRSPGKRIPIVAHALDRVGQWTALVSVNFDSEFSSPRASLKFFASTTCLTVWTWSYMSTRILCESVFIYSVSISFSPSLKVCLTPWRTGLSFPFCPPNHTSGTCPLCRSSTMRSWSNSLISLIRPPIEIWYSPHSVATNRLHLSTCSSTGRKPGPKNDPCSCKSLVTAQGLDQPGSRWLFPL